MRYLLKNVSSNNVIAGDTTSASAVIENIASTDGIEIGQYVSGVGIPINTTVVDIDAGASELTLSNPATVTDTSVNLTFYTPLLHDGQVPILSIWATDFDGGSVTIQASPDGGLTWITPFDKRTDAAAVYTANTLAELYEICQSLQIRATLTGATNPVGVYVGLGI